METLIICVLLSASIIGLTFIIERGLALRGAKIIPPAVVGALEICRTDEDLPMLRRICEQNPSPLGRLLLLAGKHRQWPRAENSSALETSARHEVSRLERGLVVLEIIVGIAPLLGLVGTIYGLIELFAALGAAGLGDNNALAHGISTALISTLFGLLTAIPSLVAWSYYSKKVESQAVEMAALCDNFLRQLYHGEETPEASETLARRAH
ncbi:MAG TPA: MotA/TolQ/ExbB proton channel family protein [Verrucomicrobiae bacterium]|jgi:biopolymer transport protein ExbB|nr:MotA/TolQ/ExbB proton channel family protein [Verrucomicrobiae bacterium]